MGPRSCPLGWVACEHCRLHDPPHGAIRIRDLLGVAFAEARLERAQECGADDRVVLRLDTVRTVAASLRRKGSDTGAVSHGSKQARGTTRVQITVTHQVLEDGHQLLQIVQQ